MKKGLLQTIINEEENQHKREFKENYTTPFNLDDLKKDLKEIFPDAKNNAEALDRHTREQLIDIVKMRFSNTNHNFDSMSTDELENIALQDERDIYIQ